MEAQIKNNPLEIDVVVNNFFRFSNRPTLLNCRLVCQLWKQEADKFDLRSPIRKVCETAETLICITQYLDISERVSLSLSCTTLYGRMSDCGSTSKDMEKYREKRSQMTESLYGKMAYYYRNINKIKYVAMNSFGVFGSLIGGMMFNIPTVFYEIFSLENAKLEVNDYAQVTEFLKERGEEGLKEIIEYFSNQSILPECWNDQAIKEASALFGKHLTHFEENGKTVMVQFATENTSKMATALLENRGKVFLLTAILGGVVLCIRNKDKAKEVFFPDWDNLSADFERSATIEIPNKLLRKFGIERDLLPAFPVYCNCTFLDSKVEMKFFTNEEEEIECTHGGHLLSLEESKQDLQAKVCSSTGIKVSKKSYIPLMTVLIDLQRESTKKKVLS